MGFHTQYFTVLQGVRGRYVSMNSSDDKVKEKIPNQEIKGEHVD